MKEKINITRFCDIQGVNDTDRYILEKKYKNFMAFYEEWYNTVIKEGFTISALREEFKKPVENKDKPDK